MARQGTYYIGRVLKFATLTEEKLIDALSNPTSINYRGNAWTFIDIKEYKQSDIHYIFGRLSKYSPEGEVAVVDTIARSEKRQEEPNLLIATSPFIYIPEHSGIAFLHVYNHIDLMTFIRRFCDIIKQTHNNFFVDCDIKLISDLKTFAAKLSSLDGIYQLSARVSPPNPLFSPLWKPLEDYLQKRTADKMTIIEDAPEGKNLKTDLPRLIKHASQQTGDTPLLVDRAIDLGDAAILMAADGYGKGLVRGRRGGESIIIKTSETAVNFPFSKEPDSLEFYNKVLGILEKIKKNRHMEDGDK